MGGQAFDSKREQIFLLDPSEVVIIGLDTDDGTEHPLYDERITLPLDQGMIDNVTEFGIVSPAVIRKVNGRAELVDGRQRVRTARHINETSDVKILVPCRLRTGDDGRQLGISISLNEIRQSDAMMTRARKAQRMIDFGQSFADVATVFGVTEQTARNLTKLAGLPSKVQAMIDGGRSTPSAALNLAGMPDPVAAAEAAIASGQTTAAAVTRQVRTVKTGEVAIKPPSKAQLKRAIGAEDSGLHPEFIRGLRVAIGDLQPSTVKGLCALLTGEA